MQFEYFSRLTRPVQEFVSTVEQGANIDIQVVLDAKLNSGGPTGQGKLAIVIEAQYVRLFAPTNGYFPDGAVRHEVLHVKRFHIDGVPKLALADAEDWDKAYSDGLGDLDNAIEHIVIVPEELQFHPDRREHWEAVMSNVCSELHLIPESERCLAGSLHWAFLRHVLPDSPHLEVARNFLIQHALLEIAEKFEKKFLSVISNKEEMIQVLFLFFPEIPKNRVALEYINSLTGNHQIPIP
jgi:hypothetical protein